MEKRIDEANNDCRVRAGSFDLQSCIDTYEDFSMAIGDQVIEGSMSNAGRKTVIFCRKSESGVVS